ncbi:hypothetical protein A8B75_13650 [Sphingomonadales bacterium EhC05]|nr:hypothetical protein A8B75_13650 [Sphingomonadales bacterium EhC05]
MKIDIKNILTSYFNEEGEKMACPVCTDEDSEYSQLLEIANFLEQHKLSLRPENLELAWQYICSSNMELKAELDRVAALFQLNDQSALEIYRKHFKSDIGEQIDRIIRQAVEQIHNTSEIINDGNENAIEHESALIKQADNIRGGKGSVDIAIQKLLDLSRLMVESTRENREQILQTNMKLAELQSELEVARNEADCDKLTRLPNRRKFDRILDIVIKKFENEQQPFVLAFVDVDHFKRVNDTFGHECGDRVLRLVADELMLLSNSRCHTSRYGGEEFAIIFEDDNLDSVMKKVDKCREAFAKRSLVDVESGKAVGHVTFSAGIAQCLPGDTKQAILRKADLALYEAKSGGRNMVLKYSNGH